MGAFAGGIAGGAAMDGITIGKVNISYRSI